MDRDSFPQHLRRALGHLYDPDALRGSLLIRLFEADRSADPASAVQQFVLEGIESLKPAEGVPPATAAWRTYHILYYRFTEGFTQQEVASDLAVSTRQLRRQEKAAIRVLADYLWTHHHLDELRDQSTVAEAGPPHTRTPAESLAHERELEWLKLTMPTEAVDIATLLPSVIETVGPLIHRLGVTVVCHPADGLPSVAAQTTSLRQAMVIVVTTAARHARSGDVCITIDAAPPTGTVRIDVMAWPGGGTPGLPAEADDWRTASELIDLSRGSLEIAVGGCAAAPFHATIELPGASQMPVLVIDDNVDTLQLIERYLAGTRYQFIGATDPLEGLAVAERQSPVAVVLDVMLPGTDGWNLLGRLRAHPRTSDVPIIVCTILPERDLALALGAAEFIQKPVSQQSLLATLDRLAVRSTGSQ